MANWLNDEEITRLILVRKELPPNWEKRLRGLRPSKTLPQTRSNLLVTTSSGNFRITIRRNTILREDFSVILCALRTRENRWFRLRRYNGLHSSGIHRNRIEKTWIRGFHIHMATLRYQQRGLDEDGYAEPTERYKDVWSALESMLRECGFIKPATIEHQPGQMKLFNDT
jgi:hypothetical protein